MNYRAEIDGLRALAVLPVMLFHGGIAPFSGGFVGVDVFFVISGYLITRILINELEQGEFSLIRFYERRARRILPALFFVMACCIPFAWMWMLPSAFMDFSQALVAVSLFGSNILFWRKTGYFETASELNPLLHTWSLAVEEQFYILFPLLLLLIWRFGRNPVLLVILAGSALSLALSEYAYRNHDSANFFLLPTRAWELGTGAACALFMHRRQLPPNQLLPMFGLALIALPVFLYSVETPFPSLYALAPVAGTALIILFAGPETLIARLLSGRPLVAIGLISYSAYLWHQPLFAFARLRLADPSQMVMLFLMGASFILATLTWRFIEQPFRRRGSARIASRKTIFAAASAGAITFFAAGAWGIAMDGAPGRFGDRQQQIVAIDAMRGARTGLHADCNDTFTTSSNCRTSDSPEFLVWGDSYAMHLAPALAQSEQPAPFQQHTVSNCAPLLGISLTKHNLRLPAAKACILQNDRVLDWLRDADSVQTVVLSTSFSIARHKLVLRDGTTIERGNHIDIVVKGFLETARAIRELGKSVVVVSRTPGTGANLGQCLANAAVLDLPEDHCDFPKSAFSLRTNDTIEILSRIEHEVGTVQLADLMCNESMCDTMQDGTFIYRDAGHMTKQGSELLGRKYNFANVIRAAAK